MPQGIFSYGGALGVPKTPDPLKPGTVNVGQGPNLAPGQNIPDPSKVLTQGQKTATDINNRNMTNPGQALTGLGQQYQNAVGDKLNNPEGNTTSFGNTYDKNLTNEANSGKLYGVDNLRAQTQNANAQNLSQSTNKTQESLASQGILPGTAGYARALALNNAGVQESNLNRTQALNQNEVAASKDINARLAGREAQGYAQNQTALGQANNLEIGARNTQNTAVNNGFNQETNQYNKNQTQYTQGETARLENKTTQASLINSVTDPRAKALLQGVLNGGGNVQEAYNQMFGISGDQNGNIGGATSGTLGADYRSSTPSQTEVQGLTDEIKAYNPQNPGESPADYNKRIQDQVNKMGNQIVTQKYAPLDQGTKNEQSQSIQEKLNTLPADKLLDPADFETAKKNGVIKQFTSSTIPMGTDNVQKFLLDNPSGIINLNGSQYKVISGASPTTSYTNFGNPRHSDEVKVQDDKGNIKYVYDGKLNDNPHKNVAGHYWDVPGTKSNIDELF